MISWTKKADFPFFLKRISNIGYEYWPELVPTRAILDLDDWTEYEPAFNALIAERQVEKGLNQEELDGACLLCAENSPAECHRRLVAEYLQAKLGLFEIVHLQVEERNRARKPRRATP
jgi:uncharacterized protein (DUF488 family)